MAKTATKAKTPKSSKPTKVPETKVGPKVADIRMISLNHLVLSDKNVRKVPASETEDAELLASIREEGVKQNLVVYEGKKGTFHVDAGGRRLKALQTLAEEGAIAKTHPVACLVEDEASATLSSTIENVQRVAMHPADQFEAFATMIDEGRSEENIAMKFGVNVGLVKRRLKLARVAPEIFEAFRYGDLSLECVMAFTVSDNHDRQMVVWNTVKEQHHYNQHVIKRMLTETSYSANSKLAQFVGVKAYEEAGGTIMSDLFSERDTTYLENPELVERLALEKLQEASNEFVGKWKWVDVHMQLEHGTFRSFGRVSPQEVDPDPQILKEIETLTAREEELAQMGEEGDMADELYAEYEAIEPKVNALRDQIGEGRPFADEDRAIAGVVLSIGWNGELEIEKGLVRPEDIPQVEDESREDGVVRVASPTSSSPAPVADPAAAMRKAEGMPNSLADDLRTARHHILRAHLAADYDVAFDAMLYSMCKKALGSGYVSGLPLDVSLTRYYAPNGEKLVAGSVADRMLEALKDTLNLDWIELETPSDFKAMCILSDEDKQTLFAWAAATALNAQLASDNRPSPVIEELGARMDVDVAACWRPTAANYWSSVTKAHIATVAKDVIGDEFAEERSCEKKGEAAAAMETAFAENALETAGLEKPVALKSSRWLPKGMEFAEANFVDEPIEDETGSEAGADADLPAFLAEEDAA